MLAVTDLGSAELSPVASFVRYRNQHALVLATGSSKAAEIPLTGSFLSRRNGGMPFGSHRSRYKAFRRGLRMDDFHRHHGSGLFVVRITRSPARGFGRCDAFSSFPAC